MILVFFVVALADCGGAMKNFKMVPAVVKSVKTYVIESVPDRVVVSGVEQYCSALIAIGRARLTVSSYVGALARYLDFVVEYVICSLLLGKVAGEMKYEDVVHVFFESLTVGCNSDDELIRMVCVRLNRRLVKRRTVNVYRSALKFAFEVSDKFVHSTIPKMTLLGQGGNNPGVGVPYRSYMEFSRSNSQRIYQTSFLAGCISGGIKASYVNLLPKYYRGSARHYIGELRLNFHKLLEILPEIKNVRDRCLLALLAAGGERISEALQTLTIDIDPDTNSVLAIDPSNRPSLYYEMGLSVSQVSGLRWKGRKNNSVFLIPPFDKIFWDSYAELLVSDKYPVFDASRRWVTHKFIFRVLKGKTRGQPLALASEGVVRKMFKRLLKRYNIVNVSPHDIRHCYVTFLIHEVPVGNGRGLGVEVASDLVSHVKLESTLVYDHLDRSTAQADIEEGYKKIGYHPEMLKP